MKAFGFRVRGFGISGFDCGSGGLWPMRSIRGLIGTAIGIRCGTGDSGV